MKLRALRTAIPAILLTVTLGFVGQPAYALSSTPATITNAASVESPQLAAAAYRPYTSANFRYNLVQRTGYNPGSRCQAHHTMPQTFSTFFGAKGITIHSPAYGLWWVSTAGVAGNHSSMAARYNRDWQNWIDTHGNSTKTQVLQFNSAMVAKYQSYYRC